MPRQRKYTDGELMTAIASSQSIRQVLQKLGKALQGGGSYNQIHRDCERLGLDTSHFTGQGHLKGRHHGWSKKMSWEEILVENSPYVCTSTLKARLLKENMIRNECSICEQRPEWNGKPLVMVLDHENGKNNDHRLRNLRLICPNCNSQQPTFAGRNKRQYGGMADAFASRANA